MNRNNIFFWNSTLKLTTNIIFCEGQVCKHNFGCAYKSAICKWADCLCTHAKRFVSHEIKLKPMTEDFRCSWHLLWGFFFFPLLFLNHVQQLLHETKGNHIWWANAVCCPLTYLTTHNSLMYTHSWTHTYTQVRAKSQTKYPLFRNV